MAKRPKVFTPFYSNVVKSGETSGHLDEVLTYLADEMEKDYDMTSKIKGAMIYPVVIIVVVLAVLFLLSYFVMPNLISMLSGANIELPVLTQFVIGFTNFIRGVGGIVVLLALIGIVVFVLRFSRTEKGKIFFDELSLRVPVLKNLCKILAWVGLACA